MEKLNALALRLLFAVPLIFLRLYILIKIYDLTLVKSFGSPHIGMYQMFAFSWFFSALAYRPLKEDSENNTLAEDLTKMITLTLLLLLSWGLAALIF
jgi:hypothetical protein